jgi:hypothetical protein
LAAAAPEEQGRVIKALLDQILYLAPLHQLVAVARQAHQRQTHLRVALEQAVAVLEALAQEPLEIRLLLAHLKEITAEMLRTPEVVAVALLLLGRPLNPHLPAAMAALAPLRLFLDRL